MTISNFPSQGINALHHSRYAIHFAEDGGEEGAFSTTNWSDNSGQAALLDGHVNVIEENPELLSVLISRTRSVAFCSPLERSIGDTDGVGIDWVGIGRNWDSLRSHQEGVGAAPGSSGDGASTK